jgi:predicted ATPase
LLGKVVPGTKRAEYAPVGQKETIRFKQDVGDRAPWAFDALSMSDGTLRVFGILLAMYQVSPPSLIAIEEPEATIHPAALDVLVDILKDRAQSAQILITTHSPEFIDNKNVSEHEMRAVECDKGETTIAKLAHTPRAAIIERLYSPGELLRAGEIEPDREEAKELARQFPLFKL